MLRDRLKAQITKLAAAGVTDYHTGMAEGTGLWAAKAVLILRQRENLALRLHCIIPYANQSEKWGRDRKYYTTEYCNKPMKSPS